MASYIHFQGIPIPIHFHKRNKRRNKIIDVFINKKTFHLDGVLPNDFIANPSSYEIKKVQEVEFICDDELSLPKALATK